MSLITHFKPSDFLQRYWQQSPLFVEQCFTSLIDMVHGDDLAGLACDEYAESRIIRGFGLNGDWRCEQGPFTEETFAKLPDTNWTLLVQGLDQWDEEFRHILAAFDFLPRWRLEDIMASYAPKGGGVGPHFDYYDVFLIQVSGTRQWQIGQQCNDQTALQKNDDVKLLEQFETHAEYTATPGDMLYIPAGVAHWGTASSDDCITLSVGFRAPSEKEIMTEVFDDLVEQFSEQLRYRDSLDAIDANPFKMNGAVEENIKQFAESLDPKKLEQALNKAFGCLVTEPRYLGFVEPGAEWQPEKLLNIFAKQERISLEHAAHARFAFSKMGLFASGEFYPSTEAFSRQICDGDLQATQDLAQLRIVCELLNSRLLEIVPE